MSGGEMRVFRPKFGHLTFRRDGPNIHGMIDKDPRGWDKPSDHTPIIVEIAA